MSVTTHTAAAAAHRTEATASFERCDTDGFATQAAHGIMAEKHDLEAKLAANDGLMDLTALFLADGTIASTREVHGRYGYSWLLTDAAAERLGRRFLSTSSAAKGARRHATDLAKGVTHGTIRIRAHVALVGGGTGFAGMASVRAATLPNTDALDAGDFTIVTTDKGPGRDW